MGILDDVVVNAKSAATAVGKKAGELVDLSKLRINAADISGEINKKYQELGRILYQAKKEGAQEEDAVKSCIALIDELYEQLDAVNAQILLMRHKKVCGNCKKENSEDAAVCSACGAALDEKPEE